MERIMEDLNELQNDPPFDFSAGPEDDDILHWKAIIFGPADTPYFFGCFELDIVFPEDYPFKPPKVTFMTKIFHPNISEEGFIYLEILQENWSPALTIMKVLLSISTLLSSPNFDCPLVEDVAFNKENKSLYTDKAEQWTEKYA